MICDSCWGFDAVLHPCVCEEPFLDDPDTAGTPSRRDPLWSLWDRLRRSWSTLDTADGWSASGAD